MEEGTPYTSECTLVAPPRIQFRYEDWRCGVHFLEGSESSFCHRFSNLTERYNLRDIGVSLGLERSYEYELSNLEKIIDPFPSG